jgi:hypothetical protein
MGLEGQGGKELMKRLSYRTVDSMETQTNGRNKIFLQLMSSEPETIFQYVL